MTLLKVSLFVDMEFPRGRGTQVENSWKFQGVGGSTISPLEDQNGNPPLPCRGGIDIFWNHTLSISKCFILIRFNSKGKSKRFSESKLCIINYYLVRIV